MGKLALELRKSSHAQLQKYGLSSANAGMKILFSSAFVFAHDGIANVDFGVILHGNAAAF